MFFEKIIDMKRKKRPVIILESILFCAFISPLSNSCINEDSKSEGNGISFEKKDSLTSSKMETKTINASSLEENDEGESLSLEPINEPANSSLMESDTVEELDIELFFNKIEMDTQTIEKGEKLIEPQCSRAKILGWYLDQEFITKWDFSQTVEDDMTLYAKIEPIHYTVHFFLVNGGLNELEARIEAKEYATRTYEYGMPFLASIPKPGEKYGPWLYHSKEGKTFEVLSVFIWEDAWDYYFEESSINFYCYLNKEPQEEFPVWPEDIRLEYVTI